MASLADVIRKKRSTGQSRTGSFFGSLKDKLKEGIDPRQLLNQTGVLTALFPKLKAYKTGNISPSIDLRPNQAVTNKNVVIEKINKNTSIFAKNTMALQSLGRDFNVSRRNIEKLVKITGVKPATKTDMFFQKSEESEKLYESQVKKSDATKTELVSKPKKKNKFNWMNILGVVGGVGVIYLIIDFFKKKEKSIISGIYEDLEETIDEFKNSIKNMSSSQFESLTSGTDKLNDFILKKTGDLTKDFTESFSLKSIEKIFDSDKPLSAKFGDAVDKFKTDLVEGISNFSIIPSAQAATLPTIMPSLTKPGAAPTATGLSGREAEAMNFFIDKGWTKEQSAGIVGNLIQESNLNPEAYNKKENAQGIAQWRGVRIQKFEEKYGKSVRSASLREQLEYVNWELNNTEKNAGNELRKTTTTSQAASVVDRLYERSAGTELNNRVNNASRLLASHSKPPQTENNGLIRISSGFGVRTHPLTGKINFHAGKDVQAPMGSPIYAVSDGTVTFVGSQKGYGNTIMIDHGNGTVSLYAHQSAFAEGIVVGSKVTKGQVIGYVGSTGVSTGPHLHFELRQNGKAIDVSDDIARSALIKVLSSLNPGDKKDSLGLEQMSRFNMEGQQVATNTIITPLEKLVYVNSNDAPVPNHNKVGSKFVDNMIQMVS
jgi:murein DD-endopeptidase MepM/ murein hydrolase activator NlpD